MEKKQDAITISDTPHKDGQVGGKLEMTGEVVATIATLAARRVKGIHLVGKTGLLQRAMGQIPPRGVDAEVGESQAALDMDLVIEYGADIHEIGTKLRALIAADVMQMAGRKVVEVNIRVTDIHMAEEPASEEEPTPPRVR